jgi:hypothetical protein
MVSGSPKTIEYHAVQERSKERKASKTVHAVDTAARTPAGASSVAV